MKNIAPAGHRLVAGLIDLLVGTTVYLVLILMILSAGDIKQILSASLTTLIYIIIVLPIVVPLVNLFLITNLGGTVGKLASGLAIVDANGQNLNFTKAFFRNVVGHIVSSCFFWLGFTWILVDGERRAWHDMIADSYVVKKSETGLVTGFLALVLLLGANGYIGYLAAKNVWEHRSLYQEVFQDLKTELETTKAPMKNTLKYNLDRLPTPNPTTYPVY